MSNNKLRETVEQLSRTVTKEILVINEGLYKQKKPQFEQKVTLKKRKKSLTSSST